MASTERKRVVAYLSNEMLKAGEDTAIYQKIAENELLSRNTREQMAKLAIREIFYAAACERLIAQIRAGALDDVVIPEDD